LQNRCARRLPVLNDALLGFDLKEATTHEKAQEIADYLKRNMEVVAVTLCDTHPML